MSKFPAPNPPYVGPAAHTSGSGNKPIHRIVIHSTVSACVAGGARQIGAYFRSQAAGGSAHYIVDPGEVVQSVYDDVIGWHAPPNPHSIGIEMCDVPGPLPGDKPGTAAFKAAKRAWRWTRPEQQRMLARTATLAAELCLANGIPAVFLTAAALRRNPNALGITTHNNVSQAFHQSTHWDPGFWPQRRFMRMVRAEIKRLRAEAAGKPTPPKPAPQPTPVPVPVPVKRAELVVATCNLPNKDRPGWLPRTSRARALAGLCNRLGVEVIGLQELATVSRVRLNRLRRYATVDARPNNVLKDGTTLGNSIAYRDDRQRVLDTTELHVDMEGRSRGLNMPVALLEDVDSTGQYVVMDLHQASNHPSRRIGVETRARGMAAAAAYAAQLRKETGLPVIPLGDFNTSDAAVFEGAGFTVGAYAKVDWILGAGVTFGPANVIVKGARGAITDHELVTVAVSFPVNKRRVSALPDPKAVA